MQTLDKEKEEEYRDSYEDEDEIDQWFTVITITVFAGVLTGAVYFLYWLISFS